VSRAFCCPGTLNCGPNVGQDCHLVSQHDDLDRKVRVRAADEPDQLKEAAEQLVEERESQRPMLVAQEP